MNSDEVNILVYRYLQESGFLHTAFTFAYESLLQRSSYDPSEVPPGALLTFLQKGLAYTGIEEHLNEDGSERQCDEDFNFLTKHCCQTKGTGSGGGSSGTANGGREGKSKGSTSGSSGPSSSSGAKNASKSSEGGVDGMDVDTQGDDTEPRKKSAGGNHVNNSRGDVAELEEDGTRQHQQIPPPPPPPPPPLHPRNDEEIPQEDAIVLTDHASEVFMCAWNPRFDLLASGSGDSTARIWQMTPGLTGREAERDASNHCETLQHGESIRDKNKDVTTLEWNREGKLLATGSYDGIARIWEQDGALRHTLQYHKGPIFSLRWNASGTYLLSGSSDKSAIVWDVGVGRVKQRFEFHEAPVLDVDWKDDNTFATCSTDKAINILAVGEDFPRQTFTGHTDEVNAIKWDPTGEMLASCSDDYTAKIWRPNSPKYIHDLTEHKKEIYTIKWSPLAARRRLLASASFDATVKLWDVERGVVLSSLNRHEDPVYSVAFSPSGAYLASGSFAGHLCIWNVSNGTLVKSYEGDGDIFEVAWNHREDRVAACFSSRKIAVIDFRV